MRITSILTITIILLNSQILTTFVCPTGCIACDATSKCTQCDLANLFYFKNGSCIKSMIRKCAVIDSNGKCIQCQKGNYLFMDLFCLNVVPIDFCESYDPTAPSTVCLTCTAPKILYANVCLNPIFACEVYDPETGFCFQCKKQYKLSITWKQCLVGLIRNCDYYDQLGYCRQCNDKAPRLSLRKEACLPIIPSCTLHSSIQNKCMECEHGFQKTSDDRQCLPEIPGCETYDVSTFKNTLLNCLRCKPNFLLVTSSGWLECRSQLANCKNFDSETKTCVFCKDGYMITDDSLLCLAALDNCAKYAPSTFSSKILKCEECGQGFRLYNPTEHSAVSPICAKIIFDCTKYDLINVNKCSECSANHRLSNDNQSCSAFIPNCLVYKPIILSNDPIQCLQCTENSNLSSDFQSCIKIIPGCLSFSDDKTLCIKCQENYRLSDDGQKCLSPIDNCAIYLSSNESHLFFVCEKCTDTFVPILENTKCVKQIDACLEIEVKNSIECKRCLPGFLNTDDRLKCLPEILDCLEYAPSGIDSLNFKCNLCNDDSDLLNDRQMCLKKITGCLHRSQPYFRCDVCAEDLRPTDDHARCLSPINNCKEYDTSTGNDSEFACKICADDFQRIEEGKFCIGTIDHCMQRNTQSWLCEACVQGFFVANQGTACLEIVKNCEEYIDLMAKPDDLLCKKCKSSFELYQQGRYCVPIIPNCFTRNDITYQCLECKLGHRLANDGLNCTPRIDNCTEIFPITDQNPKITCAKCSENFEPESQGEICVLKVAECIHRDSFSFLCTKCTDGKIPTTDGLACLQTINHCSEYIPSNRLNDRMTCTQCIPQFELFSNRQLCLPVILNCKERDPQSHLCSSCLEPYTLTTDNLACLLPIDNCSVYIASTVFDTKLQCGLCIANFIPISNGDKCVPVIDKCIRRNSLLLCVECSLSSLPTSDGLKCLPVVQNCQSYSNNSSYMSAALECVSCNPPFILRLNQCLELPKILNCNSQNLINGLCSKCSTGFVLTSDSLSCLPEIASCVSYTSNSTFASKSLICLSCSLGKMPTTDGAQCLPILANCDEYLPSTISTKAFDCKTCSQYFELQGTLCVRNGLPNCLLFYKETNLCGVCETNFSLTDDRKICLPDIFFCIIIDPSSVTSPFLTCSMCLTGFVLSDDKRRCNPRLRNCLQYLPADFNTTQLTCKKCDILYVVQSDGTCKRKVIDNCKQISSTTALCTACFTGYTLTSDGEKCMSEVFNCKTYSPSTLETKSLICEKCLDGSTLTSDNICYNGTIAYCTQFDTMTKTCNACDLGKVVSSDKLKCLNPIFSCEVYEVSNVTSSELLCKTCKIGYQTFFAGKICGLKVELCIIYDPVTFICKSCIDGYHATSDGLLCLVDIPNCLIYDFSTKVSPDIKCLQCKPQFMLGLQNLNCIEKVIDQCKLIDPVTGLCIECSPGYRLTDDKELCLEEVANCRLYQESSKFSSLFQCIQCRSGFQLIAMFCFQRPIPFCESRELITGLCKTCIEGKRITDDGEICLDEIENCGEYAPSSKNSENFKCNHCLDGNFFMNENCVTFIDKCISYNERYFYCNECSTGYSVTNDGEKCLSVIDHCEFYVFSTVESSELTCMYCEGGFYSVDQGRHCSSTAQIASGNFTLTTGTNVAGYDPTVVECDKGWMLTDDAKRCLPNISSCFIYQSTSKLSSQNICLKCIDGFELGLNGEVCLAISNF